jgi:hypothetical protein
LSLHRTNLIAYRSSVVTPDVAEALRHVEIKVSKWQAGLGLTYKGVERGEANWRGGGNSPELSMRPSGREVRLRLTLPKGTPTPEDRHKEVAMIWGFAVPLGFTPWNRYPVPGPEDDLFHFIGPWQPLFDHLCGEGRGELAWSSVCCAAQSDVGSWEGDRRVERFVQTQLHRLGLHCGPVDGIVGDRTTMALNALGVRGKTLDETAGVLSKFELPPKPKTERRFGHIILDGDDVAVFAYGGIAAQRTKQGVALAIDGPGKVILDIGQEV